MNNNESKDISKLIKKDFNKLGLTILMKELLANLAVIIFAMFITLVEIIKDPNITNYQLEKVLDNGTYNGIMSIVAVLVSFIPFMIYRGKKFFYYDLKLENRKFTFRTLVFGFIVIIAINSSLVLFSNILEIGLNAIGLSANSALEDLDALNELTVPMIIYSCILGPIIEEFIYRGAVLRSLQKYGKRFAIIVSALLFGLMHGNFFQIFMGVGIGIILGYLATEYSIKLTIILHIINNISVQVLSQSTSYVTNNTNIIINMSLISVSFIILMIAILRNKNNITGWLQANTTEKGIWLKFFTSILVIVVIIFDLFSVISSIKPIS
ncbi:CPBP family intramembrane metalloprotease [Clostridium chromiireducens]|uniref:CPBP family intramembrane metalloprotease n=1 Tax=Clostridium chromiireducens TaxID=225345 RepID=A0A964RQD6_9CLOT|nr:type II CAAX endopeptidase family protein [Clostridium chromiireducens]MVX66044.1 CPBP family intramembrane metalloprotease [Clostridium chromiireducens]